MKSALNNQVGMLGDVFLWLVANLKQGVIYFIKQALPPNISAGSVQKSLLVKVKDIVRRPQNLKKNLPLTFDFYSVFRQMYEECFPKLCGILTLY